LNLLGNIILPTQLRDDPIYISGVTIPLSHWVREGSNLLCVNQGKK
jgi:hypothetical protein